ncbi:hypothetical protein G6L29_10520 [Agrobacterium rhizogenes]|uniref:hypothetical protein n=1 Tax=Rhizobium rhizogenes TaxID=359 RepID=UPI001571FC35|nr:hypothetical protein [Rhizobium rhizogenes]NTI16069.1 hypothetical protein [Rhizobium rhizogenes]
MISKALHSTLGEFVGHPVEKSAESAKRRLDLIGTRLALPVTPQPGEGLPDLYLRAISRNGEEFASTLWPLLAGVPKAYFSHRNFVDLEIEDRAFCAFLGTPWGEMDISPLRYSRLGPGVVTFFETSLRLSSLSSTRRLSPRFLSTNGYQKAIWAISSLSFDPGNRELLLTCCPVCGEQLNFQRVRGLFHCPMCKDGSGCYSVDFRDFPQPILEMESYENIDLACALIDPEHPRKPNWQFHPDLGSLERGQLFEFIVLLARLIDAVDGDYSEGTVSPSALDAATAAIRRWPSGFIELGEKIKDVWQRPSYKNGRSFLHPVSRELTKLSCFFSPSFAKVVKNQLRAGLGTASHHVANEALTRTARFRRSIPRTQKLGGFDLDAPEDKFALAMLLARESKAVRSEAKNAGLPLIELVSLYDSGVLRCPDGELDRYFASASSGDDLTRRITSIAAPASPSDGLLLTDAVFTIARGQVPWTRVFKEVFTGNLPVKMADGRAPLIRRIFVDDLSKLSNVCKADCAHDKVIISNSDAAFYLSVTDAEIARLVTGSLLPLGGIDRAAVKAFQLMYINPSEILRFLRTRGYYTRSVAAIFKNVIAAGIPAIHKNPSTRERSPMEGYFKSMGYS